MKITKVEAFGLRCQVQRAYRSASSTFTERTALLARVTTDEGIFGWGECHCSPRAGVAMVEEVLAPALLGADPLDIEPLWDGMLRATARAYAGPAMSALDTALWDIKGKAAGMPLCRLLGGAYRDRVPAFATAIFYREGPDPVGQRVSEALGHVEKGYRALKMKVGGVPLREDVEHVMAIQKAVGDEVKVLVDANAGCNPISALQLGRELDRLGVYWFEEPLPLTDLEGYRRLSSALGLRLAGGQSLFTRHAFLPFLTSGALKAVQPSVAVAGGVTECKRVAVLAHQYGAQCSPHGWGTGILTAATLHILASQPQYTTVGLPDPPLLEMDVNENALRDDLLAEPFVVGSDGNVPVPQGPGLGVEVEMATVERYRVA